MEKRVPRSRMTSPKLLLVLMAAAAYAAPQINERQVFGIGIRYYTLKF